MNEYYTVDKLESLMLEEVKSLHNDGWEYDIIRQNREPLSFYYLFSKEGNLRGLELSRHGNDYIISKTVCKQVGLDLTLDYYVKQDNGLYKLERSISNERT